MRRQMSKVFESELKNDNTVVFFQIFPLHVSRVNTKEFLR